jgi:hypothetical protein
MQRIRTGKCEAVHTRRRKTLMSPVWGRTFGGAGRAERGLNAMISAGD